ncbi:hypothetical protein M9H77_03519 [Catharanthus roseus]|uniref:Uncharacterized protein n=1 Tax=Catharanthus roseus TaxID=4058 RepID=A0ACC0CBJ1_CATRO|nr:hypothetical protein M9H77_03519 [Catharanthus roseus]
MDVRASTPFLWAFEEREKLLEFYEKVSGAKMHDSFIRPGGVAKDLPLGLCRGIDSSTQQFTSRIDELEEMSIGNQVQEYDRIYEKQHLTMFMTNRIQTYQSVPEEIAMIVTKDKALKARLVWKQTG